MADLTAGRKTEKDVSPYEECPELVCVTGTTIQKGAMVGLNISGQAVKSSDPTCVKVLGRALEFTRASVGATAVGPAYAGSTIRVEQGVFIWNNGSSMTDANIGKPCFVQDDNTVKGTGTLVAGVVKKVDTKGVHVLSGIGIDQGTTGGMIAPTQVYTANDLAIANTPANGTTFDVPTTAAASTITLPATAIEGSRIFFIADGTKNGHTIQYRDATGPVNLTTALTASKRHLTVCQFLNGKWAANAYVSP